MTAKLFEYNISYMAPFETLNFDNYDYMSDCDSTNYYADKEYSDDDLEDSERDDISNVYIKEEVIDTSINDIENFDNLSESSIEDDLYGPNYDFDMDNGNIDKPGIIKMENSSPFGSEQQVSNFVNHYIRTIQAQNPNNESSDETVEYEYGSKTSDDETVCIKMKSRELFSGLEDDLPDNTTNKIKIGSCKYSNYEKGDEHEIYQPVEIKEDLTGNILHNVKIGSCKYSNYEKGDEHEIYQPVEIKEDLTDNILHNVKIGSCKYSNYEKGDEHQPVKIKEDLTDNILQDKVKIGSCEYSNCEKGDVHENDQPVEIKIESFEDLKSLEEFLRYDEAVRAKMSSYEPFNESNIKIEQTENCPSFDSLEEFLRYDETIRAKLEPCGISFYDEGRNLSANNQTVHVKMEPYEPFYGEERNLNDNNQTVHVKMEPYEHFYGEERNLSDNNQTVHVKMEPYEPFYGEERNLNDNSQAVHVKMESHEPFYGAKGNLSDDNQTVHIKMQSYEPFYRNERNLSDNNNSGHIKMKPYEYFYGAKRNLSDENQTVKIKVEPYEPLHNEVYLSDNYRAKIDLARQKEFRDSLEEFLRYDEIIGVEMEPYGSFHNDNQTIKPRELFNVDSIEKESREFYNNEEYLSDDSYESPNGNDEYYKIFNENLRDGTTVNIKSDKLIRSENSDNCADFVDEQMNEYNLSNYNSGNAYSGFEGNNNINKLVDNSEINPHFWNYVPFFDIYSTASRQSSKRKFEYDIYEEQYSKDLLSTTKQNAYTTSLNETTGESSQKRCRLACRMNERPYKCKCGKLFRKSASLNRHQNLVHHKH